MRRPILAACLAFAATAPAGAQQLPAAIAAFAAEQSQECVALGGAPRIGPAFATAVDLDGDGALDYVTDLAGIECANAWSAFCGSAGCPVAIWLARPGGLVREWSDYAQGWSVDALGAEVAVVVDQHGGACPDAAGGEADGAGACSQRLVFAAAPAAAEAPAAPPAAAESAAPPAPAAAPAEALAAAGAPGWTLREVPGGAPVAVSDGPGAIATVAVFCLGGQPWLAASLREPITADSAELQFSFSGSSVSSPARREDSAGGALIVELADRPLAGLLAGSDSEAQVALDGAGQGVLSLRGSTRAIRGALESCTAL